MVGQTPRNLEGLSARQRAFTAVCGMLLVALVVAVSLWSVGRPGPFATSAHGCVSVTIPGVTGADVVHECGSLARQWCHRESVRPDSNAQAVLMQCRKAGLVD